MFNETVIYMHRVCGNITLKFFLDFPFILLTFYFNIPTIQLIEKELTMRMSKNLEKFAHKAIYSHSHQKTHRYLLWMVSKFADGNMTFLLQYKADECNRQNIICDLL